MSLIATENFRTSHLVKQELFPENAYCREVVTYNGAARTFKVGELVESDGTIANQASDIVGVVMVEVDAPASTDTNVLTIARGPAMLSKSALVLGGLAVADVVAKLKTMGIIVNDAV